MFLWNNLCIFFYCLLYYLLIILHQELLIDIYLIVIYYLLCMLLLLWEKSLHWFHNILGVLKLVLFYMVNCCIHVEKWYRIWSFFMFFMDKIVTLKNLWIGLNSSQTYRDVDCFDLCRIDELVWSGIRKCILRVV